MASDYGLNFGFRVSDESARISEGRFKTPVGEPGIMLLGTAVEVDPANEGRLRQAAADAEPRTGVCGLLLQEEIHLHSIYDTVILDSFSLNRSKPDKLSVITNGPGVKVWFQNTAQENRADGRVIPAVTMVDALGDLSVGDQLGWDGSAWAVVDGDAINNPFMEVVHLDVARNRVEATLLR